ncbi:MAG: hypothetical protein K1060chlam2_01586, partial [Chlamydiae bacterium]|nr:hypothetical protein [Chlamydiota bacterium]
MERAVQPLDLSHSEIEESCRLYFQDRGTLQSFELLSGGAVNSTFKIRWEDEWFVLRFYVREKQLADVESHLYRLIQDSVPVPEMLFTSSEKGPYPFALFRFCEAPHIYESERVHSQSLSYELGEVLSKIHNFRFPIAGLFGNDLSIATPFEEGSSPYFDTCLEHLTESSNGWERLGNIRAEKIRNFIEKHKDYFPTIQRGGALVHSDFKPVNLLWDENQGLTVLDWEFAHSGHSLID